MCGNSPGTGVELDSKNISTNMPNRIRSQLIYVWLQWLRIWTILMVFRQYLANEETVFYTTVAV